MDVIYQKLKFNIGEIFLRLVLTVSGVIFMAHQYWPGIYSLIFVEYANPCKQFDKYNLFIRCQINFLIYNALTKPPRNWERNLMHACTTFSSSIQLIYLFCLCILLHHNNNKAELLVAAGSRICQFFPCAEYPPKTIQLLTWSWKYFSSR